MAPEGDVWLLPIPRGSRLSAGGAAGFGGAHYRAAASVAGSPWTGLTGSRTAGFQSLVFYILILCSASTPLIQGGSRKRARPALCYRNTQVHEGQLAGRLVATSL